MEIQMVMANISGAMEIFILACSRMDKNMEKENGRRRLMKVCQVNNLRESTETIRKMAMENFNGQVEISLKECI